MKPTWKGSISFGLVNIPIVLFPATEDKDVHFNLLHKEDEGRVQNQRICSVCNKVVPYSDIVKGYEYKKGEYVVMTEEDFKKVSTPSNDTIAIEDFVDPADIDPIYYETPYFITPDKKSGTAYNLLHKALLESGRVGIAKVAFRTKERLAALVASPDGLRLYTMHFADEIRQADALPKAPEVGDREMKMAQMLIESMTTKFDPDQYRDTYGDAMLNVINDKRAGKEPAEKPAHAEPTGVVDLMEILKASIEKSQAQAKRGEGEDKKAA